LFIVPQRTIVWLVLAETVLEKDTIALKKIFLFIHLYAHGGIPYLAILLITCQMASKSNYLMESGGESCTIYSWIQNPLLSIWLGRNSPSDGGVFLRK
jgi:hypothetical protein